MKRVSIDWSQIISAFIIAIATVIAGCLVFFASL